MCGLVKAKIFLNLVLYRPSLQIMVLESRTQWYSRLVSTILVVCIVLFSLCCVSSSFGSIGGGGVEVFCLPCTASENTCSQ